jgi:hypothetical protein
MDKATKWYIQGKRENPKVYAAVAGSTLNEKFIKEMGPFLAYQLFA